jgi:hypothetical protein
MNTSANVQQLRTSERGANRGLMLAARPADIALAERAISRTSATERLNFLDQTASFQRTSFIIDADNIARQVPCLRRSLHCLLTRWASVPWRAVAISTTAKKPKQSARRGNMGITRHAHFDLQLSHSASLCEYVQHIGTDAATLALLHASGNSGIRCTFKDPLRRRQCLVPVDTQCRAHHMPHRPDLWLVHVHAPVRRRTPRHYIPVWPAEDPELEQQFPSVPSISLCDAHNGERDRLDVGRFAKRIAADRVPSSARTPSG